MTMFKVKKPITVFMIVIAIIAIIIDDVDARNRRKLCRYRPKTNTCRDILKKQHRRLPRACKVHIPGMCAMTGGKCVQKWQNGRRNICACVTFHDF